VTRFNLIAFVCVSFLFTGCYMSHERPEEMTSVEPPPSDVCAPPAVMGEPVLTVEQLDVADRHFRAGDRGVALMSFRIDNVSDSDAEIGEFFASFQTLAGSLMARTGQTFIGVRFEADRTGTLFGPEQLPDDADLEGSVRLWDATMLRAGHSITLTLVVDVNVTANEGEFDVALGESDCRLIPRAWYVPDMGDTYNMPLEVIANNAPISVHVTVDPLD